MILRKILYDLFNKLIKDPISVLYKHIFIDKKLNNKPIKPSINISIISPFALDFSEKQFEDLLFKKILKNVSENNTNIIFSELNSISISLSKRLCQYGFKFGVLSGKDKNESNFYEIPSYNSFEEIVKMEIPIDCIVAVSSSSRKIHEIFNRVRNINELREIPFIYKNHYPTTYPLIHEYDKYKNHFFITSQFDDGLLEDIYRYSLTKVKMKCEVRDAYDLFQCLQKIEKIEGDVIEFGSFEGHSGLLMAEFLKRNKLNKNLYLCDIFEKFPNEKLGVDRSWNGTHIVNFSNVKDLFEPYEFAFLIKGEFEKTVHRIPSTKFSFVMIDCDSYRATRFVADFIFPKLARGGIMFFEDYGHGHCLGARMAVDDFITENQDKIYSFFSFFSGARVVIKLE